MIHGAFARVRDTAAVLGDFGSSLECCSANVSGIRFVQPELVQPLQPRNAPESRTECPSNATRGGKARHVGATPDRIAIPCRFATGKVASTDRYGTLFQPRPFLGGRAVIGAGRNIPSLPSSNRPQAGAYILRRERQPAEGRPGGGRQEERTIGHQHKTNHVNKYDIFQAKNSNSLIKRIGRREHSAAFVPLCLGGECARCFIYRV